MCGCGGRREAGGGRRRRGRGSRACYLLCPGPGLPTPVLSPSLWRHTPEPSSRVSSTWNLVQQLGLQNW